MNKWFLTNLRQQLVDLGLKETVKTFDMEMYKLYDDIIPDKKYKTYWMVQSDSQIYGTYSSKEAAYKVLLKLGEQYLIDLLKDEEDVLCEIENLKNQYETCGIERFGYEGWFYAIPVDGETED